MTRKEALERWMAMSVDERALAIACLALELGDDGTEQPKHVKPYLHRLEHEGLAVYRVNGKAGRWYRTEKGTELTHLVRLAQLRQSERPGR